MKNTALRKESVGTSSIREMGSGLLTKGLVIAQNYPSIMFTLFTVSKLLVIQKGTCASMRLRKIYWSRETIF